MGWSEFGAKRYQQAAAAWRDTAAKYPKDKLATDAPYQEGVALHEAKQLDHAVEVLQAFAAAHPDNPNAVKAKQLAASCLKDLNKPDESRKLLESIASQTSGTSDSVLYDLAWAQRDAKQDSAAAEGAVPSSCFERATRHQSSSPRRGRNLPSCSTTTNASTKPQRCSNKW